MKLPCRILKPYIRAVVGVENHLGTGKNSLLQWKSYRCNFFTPSMQPFSSYVL